MEMEKRENVETISSEEDADDFKNANEQDDANGESPVLNPDNVESYNECQESEIVNCK